MIYTQFIRSKGKIIYGNKSIDAVNLVRNYANGLRKLHLASEVRYTEGDKRVPYMPSLFPVGQWEIQYITPHPNANDHYLYPLFIGTNAYQMVEEWSLDSSGGYDKPTGRFVKDIGYGIHWPDTKYSTTTLGCIRILQKTDLLDFAEFCKKGLVNKEKVLFSVVE